MINIIKTVFQTLVLLVSGGAAAAITIFVYIGIIEIRQDFANFIGFSLFMLIGFLSKHYLKRLNTWLITIVLSILILMSMLPKMIASGINFNLAVTPMIVSMYLGLMAGMIQLTRLNWKTIIPLALFPIIMSLGQQERWTYWVEYGTETNLVGSVGTFSFADKYGREIDQNMLKDKYLVLDFWYISCHACWVKFPYLQDLYDNYGHADDVVIFAVNRPMKNDKPGDLYTRIEKKGYNFPVVLGSEELMNKFDVSYYPTVLVLDPSGKIIYRGGIEGVASIFEKLNILAR